LIQNLKLDSSAISADFPSGDWSPDPVVITVQAILYASLASSMLTTFLAMLGKQWLNRYTRGQHSGVERRFDRQIKLDGMEQWYFSVVVGALPLILHTALLLFGCAISGYLWTTNHVVATVALVFTVLGVLAYIVLVIIATLSYACLYQIPLSIAIRYILELDAKNTKYVPRTVGLVLLMRKWSIARIGSLYCWDHEIGTLPTKRSSSSPPDESAPTETLVEPLFPIASRKAETRRHVLNAACVSWTLKHSTDKDVIYSALRYIPDIDWHPQVDMVPIPTDYAYNSALECFETKGALIPGSRDKAYVSLKALVHCLLHEKLRNCFSIHNHPIYQTRLGEMYCDGKDYELSNLITIYKSIAGQSRENENMFSIKDFDITVVSQAHMVWVAQFLVCYTWWKLNQSEHNGILHVPDDFFAFIRDCTLHQSLLPNDTIADLITAAGLMVGTAIHFDDLSFRNKRFAISAIPKSIFETHIFNLSGSLDAIVARICVCLDVTVKAQQGPRVNPLTIVKGFGHSSMLQELHVKTLSEKRNCVQAFEHLGGLHPSARVSSVLDIIILNNNHPTSPSHWPTTVQSLRNVLSRALQSPVDDYMRQKFANLLLNLEFTLGPHHELHNGANHHLGSLLRCLDWNVHLTLEKRMREHEQSILYTLRALNNSRRADLFWNKGLVQNL
jgi:hypothetical protein